MELIVFDLDGTLLNRRAQMSEGTRNTLRQLAQRGVAYTVATGRTLHTARDLLRDNGFILPQVYKNGVLIWQPQTDHYSHSNLLTLPEIRHVLEAFIPHGVTPFIFTVAPDQRHAVYHLPLQTDAERDLARELARSGSVEVLPVAAMPADADVTNISALGARHAVEQVEGLVHGEPHLVAYMGHALEGQKLFWIDIHHSEASKGGAVGRIKEELGFERVICFGDSENDLSMFAMADECYAPDNARDNVKAAATAVIGHHDEDGIAEFLRQRFDL